MTSKMLLEDSEKVSREVIMYSAAQTYTGELPYYKRR